MLPGTGSVQGAPRPGKPGALPEPESKKVIIIYMYLHTIIHMSDTCNIIDIAEALAERLVGYQSAAGFATALPFAPGVAGAITYFLFVTFDWRWRQ